MLNLRVRSDFAALLRTLVPLHINIATLMSLLLVLVAGAIVANDQILGRRAALAEAKATFQSLGESIRIELQALHGPVETAVEATSMAVSLLPPERLFTIDTVRLFAQRISETDKLFSLYYGDEKGNFILVFNLAVAAPEAGAAYLAWIIQRPGGDFKQTVVMLDADYGILSTDDRQNNGYDPRTRGWYHAAMQSDRPVQTPPYVYFETNDIGITIAKRTPGGNGVVGGDLTLQTLSKALAARKTSEASHAIVFDPTTAILAADDVSHVLSIRRPNERPVVSQHTLASVGLPAYRGISRLFAAGHRDGVFETEAGGEEWVVWLSPLSLGMDQQVAMGVLAPSSEVFAAVSERMRFSLGIAAVGTAVGLLLAWLLAHAVSRPIRLLTDEAYQMRTFDLTERPLVDTRIVEVYQLSQAVQTLKRSLQDFARYVPTQLVRRLVAGQIKAEIAGQRLEVTLLFTDIADFTTISERMSPMELMHEVSEYLAEVSASLTENGATIDKYIGDAVMALWNAPVPQADHVNMACKAALDAAAVIARFNQKRSAAGKDIFHTRFGLHVGEAVIGNIGSSERMNYTALGESVNLAARLEGLNKQVGTQILVSASVQEALDDTFSTRPVDMVRVKGATRPVRVYELLQPGQYTLDGTAHLMSWDRCYTHYTGRRWQEAIDALEGHLGLYSNDNAARILLDRARTYLEAPPAADWDGVFEAKTK